MGHCRRKLIRVNKSHTLNAKKNAVRKQIKKTHLRKQINEQY